MSQMNEMRRAALNVEEASLLPALPRNRAGGAALRTALRAAQAMDEMQVSNAVSAQTAPAAPVQRPANSAERGTGSRAALHQVLRR